jgi:hypothetical protein
MSGTRVAARVGSLFAAVAVAALLLAACSTARTDYGSTDAGCYLALPTAADAVGGHGHLEGVRKYTLSQMRSVAPRLYNRLATNLSKKQGVCIAGYTGHFTAGQVTKPIGHPSGTLAVAVVTTPGNKLLGTLILTKLPVRFQHTHPF